jgi:hypothetical protein
MCACDACPFSDFQRAAMMLLRQAHQTQPQHAFCECPQLLSLINLNSHTNPPPDAAAGARCVCVSLRFLVVGYAPSRKSSQSAPPRCASPPPPQANGMRGRHCRDCRGNRTLAAEAAAACACGGPPAGRDDRGVDIDGPPVPLGLDQDALPGVRPRRPPLRFAFPGEAAGWRARAKKKGMGKESVDRNGRTTLLNLPASAPPFPPKPTNRACAPSHSRRGTGASTKD